MLTCFVLLPLILLPSGLFIALACLFFKKNYTKQQLTTSSIGTRSGVAPTANRTLDKACYNTWLDNNDCKPSCARRRRWSLCDDLGGDTPPGDCTERPTGRILDSSSDSCWPCASVWRGSNDDTASGLDKTGPCRRVNLGRSRRCRRFRRHQFRRHQFQCPCCWCVFSFLHPTKPLERRGSFGRRPLVAYNSRPRRGLCRARPDRGNNGPAHSHYYWPP
jgi:hypothetical protein